MKSRIRLAGRTALSATLALSLVACGGGGNPAPPTGGPTPPPVNNTCSIANQIAFANDVLNEWYLFPDLLDNTVNPADFNNVQDYLDARVAPARAQSRDKGFTFATSIQAENDLINSGSTAGFGIRLIFDTTNNRLFLSEVFENGPGFGAGLDRGSEITAIGINANNLQTVSSLMAAGGPQAVVDALGPSDPGVSRVLRFITNGVTTETTVTKADFSLDPISDRYGALILNDGGKQVGYLNFRTFFPSSADDQLRSAWQLFNANGVDELVIDFRYNGGGLVSLADKIGDLLGENRVGQVWSETILRPSKSSENSTELFEAEAQSLQASKIAFITTRSTASASELVINSMLPYLDADSVAIIGSNTSGKPVGQFAFDFDACDLRIRAVTFQTVNANGNGDYFSGLAGTVPNFCAANDDIFTQLGNENEASIARALDFLEAGTCNVTTTGGTVGTASVGNRYEALRPARPSAAQFEIPGLF